MGKSSTSRRKSTATRHRGGSADASGKHLVIVESPAKAKTINQYLGPDYLVQASIGHIRDLPPRAPKGSKQPVPGVDLDNHFEPTYAVLPAKKKTLASLKKAAEQALDVWFATDLDREGEAIAWHLAQELGIDPAKAKRVIFNAITRSQIRHAFENPHSIDMYKVNAQQARRILDRIVGYQVSPLLWKKVARGLSAGRVQSVTLRMVVDREREIRAFIPAEYWQITTLLSLDPAAAPQLGQAWSKYIANVDPKGNPPTIKAQNAWLDEHNSIKAELVELDGKKFELRYEAKNPQDITDEVKRVAAATGLVDVRATATDNPQGKGPRRTLRSVTGRVDPAARYRVKSVETKRTTARPPAPFITASLQVAASTALGFRAKRTMIVAQTLYEGVNLPGEGQVGLITYMRTDSTHVTTEALQDARGYISKMFGGAYLPQTPNFFGNSGKKKRVEEAHEAIRPTNAARHPRDLRSALSEEQLKLYQLIWNRFVASQMSEAQWDATTVALERSDIATGAVFKSAGRVLVFDGFYKVAGVPISADEPTLPELARGQQLAPFSIDPQQRFTTPPPRYSEASLVKALESEGIGRPSTYAQIIGVIQDRKYVEQIARRFHSTDLGEVVIDKLVEAFPQLMDVGYTRQMEEKLDKIEENHTDWTTMLHAFYDRFSASLAKAHETMTHAKAETQPAIYKCPECGSETCYRFGKNGRFLSCTAYPKCHYAAPIDRDGQPQLPQRLNVACPQDGSPMVLRSGRFGQFLASVNYPAVNCVINLDKKGQIKYPTPAPLLTDLPCPKCDAPMNLRRGKRGPWLGCSTFPKCRGRASWSKLDQAKRDELLPRFEEHERAQPRTVIRTLDGGVVAEGTPISELTLPDGIAELEIHPASLPRAKTA
ncbi:MAG: DNA topoisomerase [Planctomycetota bacterium]|nr:DNA topoisomerase [Planctomycetota bacterium]